MIHEMSVRIVVSQIEKGHHQKQKWSVAKIRGESPLSKKHTEHQVGSIIRSRQTLRKKPRDSLRSGISNRYVSTRNEVTA